MSAVAIVEDISREQAQVGARAKPTEPRRSEPVPKPPALAADTVLEQWALEGPMVHEPTGLAKLDELTGGGPVYGSRWYLLGAPDAGKTALEVQIADTYAQRGIAVGLLAVDEEPSDLLTRFLQRRGFSRAECEARDPSVLGRMRDALEELPVRFYDAAWTIERAAADLHAFATSRGTRAFLGVDSIQTVTCDGEANATSIREQVSARAAAIRAVATRYRMIVVATSEMSRGAYRNAEASEQSDDMAAAKESGAIEYSARVMLSLRSVRESPDELELRIAKNKHGTSGDRIGLRINRRLQEVTETDTPPPVQDRAERREEARVAREREKSLRAAAALAEELLDSPIVTRDVEGALRARLGACSRALADTARHVLEDGVRVVEAPGRRRVLHLHGPGVPEEVLALLPAEVRARVASHVVVEVPSC